MYCDLLGWPLPANREQLYVGAKWIHERRDLQSALYYWRKGDLTLGDWLESWRGRKAHALFSLRDPGPFLSDTWRVARALFSHAERQRRRMTIEMDRDAIHTVAPSRAP
jgi:predicted ATP-grasp superfamily ATP-dependent carboligase